MPVGSCLSGGLDSGSISCLIRQELGPEAPYHAFSGRFPDQPADEGQYIDALTASIHPIRHDVAPSPTTLLNEISTFAWMNELPVDSTSQYAQWCVFRLARQNGITVLLDGQGADEILGGYETYFFNYLQTNPEDGPIIADRYPGLNNPSRGLASALPPRLRRAAAHILNRGTDIAFGLRSNAQRSKDGKTQDLHSALRQDALDGFLGTLLRYGDRNSMAHSVEVRLPFCDHRIFEWAQSLPPSVLMGNAQTKRVLREAMRGILPETIRTRWRKQGFVPPQAYWMSQGLLPAVIDIIQDPSFARSTFWHPTWWHKAVRRFQSGETALAAPLWKLLSTEAWKRHFVARISNNARYPAEISQ